MIIFPFRRKKKKIPEEYQEGLKTELTLLWVLEVVGTWQREAQTSHYVLVCLMNKYTCLLHLGIPEERCVHWLHHLHAPLMCSLDIDSDAGYLHR